MHETSVPAGPFLCRLMPQPLRSTGRPSEDEVSMGYGREAVYLMANEIEDARRRGTGYARMVPGVGGKPISRPKARSGVDANGLLCRSR